MQNTEWFIGVLFKRYRRERRGAGKKISSIFCPWRSRLSSAVLRKQTQGFPPEQAVFNIETIKRVTAATWPGRRLQTLNSITARANSSSPQECA